jgi:hypothetical protein
LQNTIFAAFAGRRKNNHSRRTKQQSQQTDAGLTFCKRDHRLAGQAARTTFCLLIGGSFPARRISFATFI